MNVSCFRPLVSSLHKMFVSGEIGGGRGQEGFSPKPFLRLGCLWLPWMDRPSLEADGQLPTTLLSSSHFSPPTSSSISHLTNDIVFGSLSPLLSSAQHLFSRELKLDALPALADISRPSHPTPRSPRANCDSSCTSLLICFRRMTSCHSDPCPPQAGLSRPYWPYRFRHK